MKQCVFMVFFILISSNAWSQDEQYIRDHWAEKTQKFESREKERKWVVKSPLYQLDLTGEGSEEFLNFQKREGEDWLVIYDHLQNKAHEFRLQAQGAGSKIYRIRFTKISKTVQLGLIFYHEGGGRSLDLESTSRLYFLTIENGDLDKAYFSRGPAIFHEHAESKRHYHLRKYETTLYDFNKDGRLDLKVQFKNIARVYFYRGKGEWIPL